MNYNTSPIYEARRNALGEIAEINRNHPHLSRPAKRKMISNSLNYVNREATRATPQSYHSSAYYREFARVLREKLNEFNNRTRQLNENERARNAANAANAKEINWPANLEDPVSLHRKNNWGNKLAIEVNTGRRKNYFKIDTFNRLFGRGWRNMNPNSNNSIHDVKRHPITREVIKRKMVRRVKFV